MNFFEQQDKARKRTSTLVLYFILAIIFIILAIDCLILGLIYANVPTGVDSKELLSDAVLIGIGLTPLVLIVIGIGTLIRMYQTRGGGVSVAEMVKARPIDRDTQDFKEKRFINIVEEMSIASGVSVPQLFVMDNEPAINAFVAGVHQNDMVMVVTKGALDNLDRDALQGVVGHEFSHIFNGDMKINLKLIGLLGGIFAIGQLGAFVLRSLQFSSSSRSSSSSSSGSKGNGIFIILILGIGLFVIGYIGLFFGRLIKAGISRQRESLADACSVQYTRNPQGLINALTAIGSQTGSKLTSSHAEDINHMCFGPSLNMWLSSLLASHPPIEERINALDPQGYLSQAETTAPKAIQPEVSKPNDSTAQLSAILLAPAALATNASTIEQSIGNPQMAHIEYAEKLYAAIPSALKDQCHKVQEAPLLLNAILMASSEKIANKAPQVLASRLSDDDFSKIHQYTKQIKALGPLFLLPLIDIILPTFNQNASEDKSNLIAGLEMLAAIHISLFSFSVVAMIKKSATHPVTSKSTKQLPTQTLLKEISELMRFIVTCTNNDEQSSKALYTKLMKTFSNKTMPDFERLDFDALDFQKRLYQLNLLYPLGKEKLIHACLVCVETDQKINIEEAQAVRAIAACLNCPIPPILPTLAE